MILLLHKAVKPQTTGRECAYSEAPGVSSSSSSVQHVLQAVVSQTYYAKDSGLYASLSGMV
jgi:hypothetical protein